MSITNEREKQCECKSSCGINLKEMQEMADELIILYLSFFFKLITKLYVLDSWGVWFCNQWNTEVKCY